MAQYFRTATPMADWRTFKYIVADSIGHELGELVLVQETVGLIFIGEPILDVNGCKIDPQVVPFGEESVLVYHIEKVIVEKLVGSAEVAFPGDKVYWSGVYGTGVSPVYTTGWYWIGIFTEPRGADEATAEIDLKGDKATLLE